jgi:tetratricopeptide (TPR) repeat protein
MGLFDFFKKENKGIENSKFYSEQFQHEICALALWKLEENNLNPNVAKYELKKIGLNDDQIDYIIDKTNQFIKKEKVTNTEQITGIDENKFYEESYQSEILDFAQKAYFQNKHSYEAVEQDLLQEGLNHNQANEIISKLKKLNADMVNAFQQDLDSGLISEIKIIPNAEHTKENIEPDQVDKYIGFGAYQMDRGDLDNALELFDKAIALDEKATLAYANKGTLYYKKDDNEKALFFYNKALQIEPNNLVILENKMDLLCEIMNESNESEFIDTVKTILKNDPENPNALIYIIQFYVKENDIRSAIESIKKLFSDYHRESIATQLLLDVFARLSKDEALKEFDTFKQDIKEDATYQLDYCKGLYLKGIREYDKAIILFEDLNKIQEFSWNYYQIAIMKNLQNKIDESLEFLKITFDMEPELKNDAKQFPELENLWSNAKFIELTK